MKRVLKSKYMFLAVALSLIYVIVYFIPVMKKIEMPFFKRQGGYLKQLERFQKDFNSLTSLNLKSCRYDDRFILFLYIDEKNNPLFGIVDKRNESVYVPLHSEDYLVKRSELGVPDDLRLKLDL